MYKICKTEESAARQHILETGLLRAMENQPYGKISVSGLCAQLGIPRKTFYRYFPSRDDALLSLIDHTLTRGNHFVFANWTGSEGLSRQDLESFFEFWKNERAFLDAIIANNFWPKLLERTTVIVNQMKENQGKASSYAREQTEYFIAYGLMLTVIRWHSHGYPGSPGEMAQSISELFVQPGISITKLFL